MTDSFLFMNFVVGKFVQMGGISKNTKTVEKPRALELLATKMATEIYPEIRRTMNDLNDARVDGIYENMEVRFSYYEPRNGMEIICQYVGASYSSRENAFVMDEGVAVEVCPIFGRDRFNSSDYMNVCEAAIGVLEDLRKRKLRISQILDKIDSLPNELSRYILIEKHKN